MILLLKTETEVHVFANWNLTETRKGFLHCWNCIETYYICFQQTETLQKLYSMFQDCWNWMETYMTGFRWRKLKEIQVKLCNGFRISDTIQQNFNSKFTISFNSVSVLLKWYFSSCDFQTHVSKILQNILINPLLYHIHHV